MTDLRTPSDLLDTREMLVVHTAFRREFGLAAGVVRGVPDRDRARAKVVAAHLDLIARTLHHHHTGEDRLLWPKLVERVPDALAPLVQLMQAQHDRVHVLSDRIADLLARWTAEPTTALGEQLASVYEELFAALCEHLEAEENEILPLVARCITEAEWKELGEAGMAGMRRSEMGVIFGMLDYQGDPEVLGTMVAAAPLPIRVIVPRLGRRAFRKHALAVYGTATP